MKKLLKYLKRHTPKSLLGRVLMILVLPTILAQATSIYMFYQRHMDHVSRQLTLSLAAEVATVVNYVTSPEPEQDKERYLNHAVALFAFSPKLMSPEQTEAHINSLKKIRIKPYEIQLRSRIQEPFALYTDGEKVITTVVYLKDRTLVIDAQYKRLVNSTSYIFILWMTGTTTLLLIISILFLRNQIRPVVRLARLADNFGRGNDISHAYKPEGAKEIRQAFTAFVNMHQRLTRFIKQRTEMLAGISHDLRTPVTRMKLELALHKTKDNSGFTAEMEKDLGELEYMINSYIEFSRGDEGEEPQRKDYTLLLEEAISRYKNKDIELQAEKIEAYSRPNALGRVFRNIIDNALKYSTKLKVKSYKSSEYAIIEFEDNGPGIEPAQYEEVFKPFYRLETSRNTETGGIGLGLSIVRDIVHSHGGTVHLEASSMGGLKVVIKLPV